MNTNFKLAILTSLSAVLLTNTASLAESFKQKHPRRAEVLKRTGNINQKINMDKGNLDGHYKQLKREDKSIVRQEQRDTRIDGGYITKGQQNQLNREENGVNRQIKRDQ